MAKTIDAGGGGGGFSVNPAEVIAQATAIYRQASQATQSIAGNLSTLQGRGSTSVMGPGEAADAFADFCRFWAKEYRGLTDSLQDVEKAFRNSAEAYRKTDDGSAQAWGK